MDASAAAQCGEAATECIDPAGCGLMQYCMPVSNRALPRTDLALDVTAPNHKTLKSIDE